jgi:NADH:ubiquinone oxidoreductase subunit K
VSPAIESVIGRVGIRPFVALALLLAALGLTAVYYRASFSQIVIPVLLVMLVVTIPIVVLWPHMEKAGVQQFTLFALLIFGLAWYLVQAWRLLATGSVDSSANVSELQKSGLQLFLPYLGIAIGGVFGVKRLVGTQVDRHTFLIAVIVLVLWDALAIGNLWAMTSQSAAASATEAVALAASDDVELAGAWAFEDALGFVNNIMPLLSFLPAAAIGFYFGSQPGKSPEEVK